MRYYRKPEMDVLKFEAEDIILSSGGGLDNVGTGDDNNSGDDFDIIKPTSTDYLG